MKKINADKYKPLIICTCYIFLIGFSLNGQRSKKYQSSAFSKGYSIDWATYDGGPGSEGASSAFIDQEGRIYLLKSDGALWRYDTLGSKHLVTSVHEGYSIMTQDDSGFLYVIGNSDNGFHTFPGGYQKNISGMTDAHLIKMDTAGNVIWGTYFGGVLNENVRNISLDNNGNIYLLGTTSSTGGIAFGGHQPIYGGGAIDGFIAKFSNDGNFLWSTYYGGNDMDFLNDCATDSNGNIYAVGSSYSTTGIAANGYDTTLNKVASSFLVKFDSTGQRQWATYYGVNSGGFSCAIDNQSNIYMVGNVQNDSTLALNAHQKKYGGGTKDGYIAKFDSNGNRLWSSFYGGEDIDGIQEIQIGNNNKLYFSGTTWSDTAIQFHGFQKTRSGERDAFIGEFTGSGRLLWASYFGGPKSDYGGSCYISAKGQLILAGATKSTTAINQNGYQPSINGVQDAFLVKFNKCKSIDSIYSLSSCNSYYWPLNGKTYYQSGKDSVYLSTSKGCDSLVSLDLNIPKFDTVLTWSWGKLSSNKGADSYQWLNCAENYAQIPGANDSTFIPENNGIYSVMININGCLDTSECLLVSNVKQGETSLTSDFAIYPNPTSGNINIRCDREHAIVNYTITDLAGQEIYRGNSLSAGHNLVLLEQPAGVYIIRIVDRHGKVNVSKIILE